MSAGSDIWRLPGPGAYIDEIGRSVLGGQHVAAVVPRYLAGVPERGDALTVAVLDQVQQSRRVQPWASDGPLVAALARQMVYADDPPVTVPDLIRHPDVQGQTFVCLTADLEPSHQDEMPEFLRRLQADSRSVPAGERCTFVVITDRSRLPKFAGNEFADVTLASCWYWNRVSRWDIAAHLAAEAGAAPQTGVLREVRTETIIELARWDFDLAARLAESWSGDRDDLAALCAGDELPEHTLPTRGPVGTRPPESLMDAWEEGLVDCWHDSVIVAPSRRLHLPAELTRHLWTGQARVLLPWIEIKRDRLEHTVRSVMGSERFTESMCQFASGDFDPATDSVAEIGLIHAVISARLGGSEPTLRDAAYGLREARNRLAHLRPLRPGRLEELVRVCSFLGG